MAKTLSIQLDESLFHPGQRIAVASSGGADSVSLLRALLARQAALGLILSIVHVHHGIRGEAADNDQAFVEQLAAAHHLPFHVKRVDTPATAAEQGETLEEAARNLRYAFFQELLSSGQVDAVATAHTRDDQAETVLHKFLRGAWTEGLGGISPVIIAAKGSIVRPLLAITRAEVEAYLHSLEQSWCEDATNQSLVHTRNRLRHHLLPILSGYNPQLLTQLSRLAAIARDEEAWWQREVDRVGRSLLIPGKPVRGGGRASSTHPDEASIAFELERLRALDPALRRRVIRWAALSVQATLDFDQTERLMRMCDDERAMRSSDHERVMRFGEQKSGPKRVDLSPTLTVQRTARELQFIRSAKAVPQVSEAQPDFALAVPGIIEHPSGWLFSTTLGPSDPPLTASLNSAVVRTVRPGDRITLRYTRGPKRVKEVFERLHIPAADRASRLLVVWEGQVLWMEGLDLEPAQVPFHLTVRTAESSA